MKKLIAIIMICAFMALGAAACSTTGANLKAGQEDERCDDHDCG